MKKHVVTASVLAGLSMVSGQALAQTGSVGANFVKVDTDFGDGDAYGIDGDVIFDVGGGWAGIVEGSFADSDAADSTVGAKGHMINRSSTNAWGGFIGLSDSDGSNPVSVGAEYAQFFDASTLALNLTYTTDDDNDVDVTAVNGAYRIFASDNLRFDIGASFGRAESGVLEADVSALGVGVEYRFDQSPFSIGGSYTRVDGDIAEADVFGVSFRWNFGASTLKAADREGKTFTGLGAALQGL